MLSLPGEPTRVRYGEAVAAMKFPRLEADSDKLLHMDTLRLIAAFGIAAYHAVGLAKLTAADDGIMRLFVDLFFVISGFVIAFVYGDRLSTVGEWLGFMRRRIARLGPLHWLTLAFMASLALAAGYMGVALNDSETFDFNCFAPNALFLHAGGLCPARSFNGPSWSISAEMAMYVAAPLLVWLARRTVLALIALAVIYGVLFAATGSGWTEWTASGGMVRALPSFILGALIYYRRDSLPRFRHGWWLSMACIVAFVGCAFIDVPDTVALLLVYAAVLGAVMADQNEAGPIIRRLAPLGQLTYSSYMLHMPVMVVLASAPARRLLGVPEAAANWIVLAAFLLVWPVSWVSYFYFETPARKWMTGRVRLR